MTAVRILTNLATAGEVTIPQYNGGLMKLAAKALAVDQHQLAIGWVSTISPTYLDEMSRQAAGDEELTRAAEAVAEFLVSRGLVDGLVGPSVDVMPGVIPAKA